MNNFKPKISFPYVVTYVNLLSFVLLFVIYNNMMVCCLCSSIPSNSIQILLNNENNWTTSKTPQILFSKDHQASFPVINEKQQQILDASTWNSETFLNNSEKFVVPENMQWKRFMWKEVDQTMENIAQGVADGARTMTEMIKHYINIGPLLSRHKKAVNSYYPIPSAASTTNVKYVIKTPLKRSKVIKLTNSPRKVVKIISAPSSSSSVPHFEALTKSVSSLTPKTNNFQKVSSSSGANDFDFLDEATLRDIEKKEEEKVEATISAILPNFEKEDIIIENHKDSDNWKPVTLSTIETESYQSSPSSSTAFTPNKSKIMSPLHTKISDLPLQKSTLEHSYEVTENSAEETVNHPHTFTSQKYASYKIPNNIRGINTESFIIHKTKTNITSDTSKLNEIKENDNFNPRKRQQNNNNNNNMSSSFSFIYRSPKIESRNIIRTSSTVRPAVISSALTHQEYQVPSKISATLKKRTKEFENIGGYKNFKDSQIENENYSTLIPFSPIQEKDKQEIRLKNRGSRKFGDRIH